MNSNSKSVLMENLSEDIFEGIHHSLDEGQRDVEYSIERMEASDSRPSITSMRGGVGGTCKEDAYLRIEFVTQKYPEHQHYLQLPLEGSNADVVHDAKWYVMSYEARDIIEGYFRKFAANLAFAKGDLAECFVANIDNIMNGALGDKVLSVDVFTLRRMFGKNFFPIDIIGSTEKGILITIDKEIPETNLFGIEKCNLSEQERQNVEKVCNDFMEILAPGHVAFIVIQLKD